MKTKTVERVYAPAPPHFVGDGFRVHNFIPSGYQLDMKTNGSIYHVGLQQQTLFFSNRYP